MTTEEREQFLFNLDDALLKGSLTPSAWCTLLILESDTAFLAGANLAAIITAVAGMEAWLRLGYSYPGDRRRTFIELINAAELPEKLKLELDELRRFRNTWVHIAEPWNEEAVDSLIDDPYKVVAEMEPTAVRAVTALRQLFYCDQGT